MKLHPIHINEDRTNVLYTSEDCQLALNMWEEFYPEIGFHMPWVGYFIEHENVIVGTCAFTGAPVNNRVEISYWTFKQNEGKGIATAACHALIGIAKDADPAVTIFAKTAPERNASTAILEKCGFVFSGIVQDHEIGDAWEWILKEK